MYHLYFTKQALKDVILLEAARLDVKCQHMLDELSKCPYAGRYERLKGDLEGCCSRRINLKHRLVYKIYESEKAIRIIRMWSHYDYH